MHKHKNGLMNWRTTGSLNTNTITLDDYRQTDRFKLVFMVLILIRMTCIVSVACFGARVSVMFHFNMFVHYTLSWVWVAEWSPFGK